jgi:heterodisulfide reductase subunit C
MGCHADPRWGFTGYAASRLLAPFALGLDRAGGVKFLWYVHILLCFAGLAYLPFSKMFHIVATPISLLANAVMEEGRSHPANIMTRQLMELDACTHCGTCSLRCSAQMAFDAMGNDCILPSEKMVVLKARAAGKALSRKELNALVEGIYVCTNCDRCTVVCPSGINLRELWYNAREELIQKLLPGPILLSQLSYARGLRRADGHERDYARPIDHARGDFSAHFDALMKQGRPIPLLSGESGGRPGVPANTFSYCFGCQNCTTVCPVVGAYEDPQEALGLLPHQIMWCLGSGLIEAASSCAMIWDCVTCYQCQEHCPQKVNVADLLYELKNRAFKDREGIETAPVPKAA